MKKLAAIAGLLTIIMVLSTITVFALDYDIPEDATIITARFFVTGPEGLEDEFSMVSEDGETIIHITNDTLIYFEDFVPLSDECDEMTQMAREVLFGRTLAEVLEGRNLRVTLDEDEVISIVILFEIAVPLPQNVEYPYVEITSLPEELTWEEEEAYLDIVTLPEEVTTDNAYVTIDPLPEFDEADYFSLPGALNGEIVVNNVIIDAPIPFLQTTEAGTTPMLPLRAIAEALDYNVSWNGELRSVQLGVAIHLWIGNTEVHLGRMAPVELSTAPVIVDNLTFVPLDFFRSVLGKTIYVFEGQVVVETYSDME